MEQSLDRFAVNMRDQIPGSETSVKCRTALVNLHDQVMHGVEIRITKVDPNCSDCETEATGASPHDNRGV